MMGVEQVRTISGIYMVPLETTSRQILPANPRRLGIVYGNPVSGRASYSPFGLAVAGQGLTLDAVTGPYALTQ